MQARLRARTSITTVVAATALMTLTACGSDGTDKGADGPATASRDVKAPLLNGTVPFTFMSGGAIPEGVATATVPGLNSTTVDIMSSAPTGGTFPHATDHDEKHSAPAGKALVAYGVKLHDAVELPSGTDYTVSVLADGKPVHTEPISSDAINDGKGFLTAVPAGARITVQLGADKGQQNVVAGMSVREEKTSNGLPLHAKIAPPIASATKCDAPTSASASSKALACDGLTYTWTDHSDNFGWAPPGRAWLTVHASSTHAPMESSGNGSFLGEPGWAYGTLSTVKLTNARLGNELLQWQDANQTLNLAFPISEDTNTSAITGAASWSDSRGTGASGTGTISITGNSRTSVKYGPPFM